MGGGEKLGTKVLVVQPELVQHEGVVDNQARLRREHPNKLKISVCEQARDAVVAEIQNPQQVFLVDKNLALSSIQLKGQESGMKKYNFLIPKGSIRIRDRDALSEQKLAVDNLQYRNRILFGSAIRADIITAIEFGFETPYAVAKAVGCSYEPAHRIFNEYKMWQSVNVS